MKNKFAYILLPIILSSCFPDTKNLSVSTENEEQNSNLLEEDLLITMPEKWAFKNEHFGYSLSLPKNSKIIDDCITEATSSCDDIDVIIDTMINTPFGVEILDAENYKDLELREKYSNLFSDTEKYANALRDKNIAETIGHENYNPYIPDKEVGELKKAIFASLPAYTFTLTGSFEHILFGNAYRGYVLNEPSHIFIFKHRDRIFIIRYSMNNRIAEAIANSFFVY